MELLSLQGHHQTQWPLIAATMASSLRVAIESAAVSMDRAGVAVPLAVWVSK